MCNIPQKEGKKEGKRKKRNKSYNNTKSPTLVVKEDEIYR